MKSTVQYSNVKHNPIEEFIDFKIKNFEESSRYTRIHQQQKKYQKKLDMVFKTLQRKQFQYKNRVKNYKKFKEHIWQELLGFNNQIQHIEQIRYRFADQTRQSIHQREKVIEQRLLIEQQNSKRQTQLQVQIKAVIDERQFYFANKNEEIDLLNKQSKSKGEQLEVLEPKIRQFYDKIIQKQSKVKAIDKARTRNQNLVKQIWDDSQILQELKEKQKNSIKERQEKEKSTYLERKESLSKMFAEINLLIEQSLKKDNEDTINHNTQITRLIQQYKKQREGISEWLDQSQLHSQKMKKIKTIFGISEEQTSTKPANPMTIIDSNFGILIQSNIKMITEELREIEEQQIAIKQQEEKQTKIEEQLDEQVQHLQSNIRKIQSNLI